jgi:polyribonucleotide nucleotidyltransferase
LFRDILGLTQSYEKSVILRVPFNRRDSAYPVSFIDGTIKVDNIKRLTSGKVKNRWYGTRTNDEIVLSMFNITNEQEMTERVFYIRASIEEVINRIDDSCVWMIQFFIDRITEAILSSLNKTEGPTWTMTMEDLGDLNIE